MHEAYRIDRGGALRSPRKNEQGFLLVDGYATRVGVLEYTDASMPDGIRRELRLPEDLFDDASLAGYEGAAVTDEHPLAMVDRHNVCDYQRGTVLAAGRRDGDHVAVSLVIAEAGLANNVEAGIQVELSPGYRIQLDPTPGVHPVYGRFDARQFNIRINHLAVVRVGRSGPSARLRLDSAVASDFLVATSLSSSESPDGRQPVRADGATTPTDATPTKDKMADNKDNSTDLAAKLAEALQQAAEEKVRADGLQAQLATEKARADEAQDNANKLAGEIESTRNERRDAGTKVAELTDRLDTATKRADEADKQVAALTARLDAANATIAAEPERVAKRVNERLEIERAAGPILAAAGKPTRFDSMTDRQVMELAITTRGGTVEATRDDGYVRGQFDGVVKSFEDGEAALANYRNAHRLRSEGSDTGGTARADGLSGRALMIARNQGRVTD